MREFFLLHPLMIQEHSLQVSRTARYYTLGAIGTSIKYCWIACHGYGQLAKHFIRKFDAVAREDTLIIAPEGLSRFYWNGLSGDVKASWMTKEARLDEIDDYANYLSQLYNHFVPSLAPDVRVILFGFSQGCATQMRWIMRDFPNFHQLILWAGTIPEDIDYKPRLSFFQDKDIHFIYGNQDQFLTPDRMDFYRGEIDKTGLSLQEHSFEGRHVVDRDMLRRVGEEVVYREEKG